MNDDGTSEESGVKRTIGSAFVLSDEDGLRCPVCGSALTLDPPVDGAHPILGHVDEMTRACFEAIAGPKMLALIEGRVRS